jgi:hypothetical protein
MQGAGGRQGPDARLACFCWTVSSRPRQGIDRHGQGEDRAGSKRLGVTWSRCCRHNYLKLQITCLNGLRASFEFFWSRVKIRQRGMLPGWRSLRLSSFHSFLTSLPLLLGFFPNRRLLLLFPL